MEKIAEMTFSCISFKVRGMSVASLAPSNDVPTTTFVMEIAKNWPLKNSG